MSTDALTAISPVDGRYHRQTAELSQWFSESALIRYRLRVEVAYFIRLCQMPLPQLQGVEPAALEWLQKLWQHFTPEDAKRIKEIEAVTNHDVKAVEYFIKEKLAGTALEPLGEFVHFGLTSQDVNNTAMPMMLKDAISLGMIPLLNKVDERIKALAEQWKDVPMLAHTHGQPASPTHLGKELFVFSCRLAPMKEALRKFKHSGKFGGATGNFNAHKVAYPHIDWVEFGNEFLCNDLGLYRQAVTTQIEHYDGWAELFQLMMRINTVLLDLDRDMWSYISMGYFTQKVKAGEVGSSAMPHKVNPIDFENSEGNIGIANALFAHLAEKLPVSRLQRDLTDSTVSRMVGVPFGHTMIAWKSLLRGLEKIELHEEKIQHHLEENLVVVAEAIQTILRREGIPNPYELLRDLTRGNLMVTRASLLEFIDSLEIPENIREELKQITPSNYTGYDHHSLSPNIQDNA